MVMFHGQWLVNATEAPSGVELWQPMQRTCPSAAPFSARLSVGESSRTWAVTIVGVRATMTPSSPGLNPYNVEVSRPGLVVVEPQYTTLPPVLTGAIWNLPTDSPPPLARTVTTMSSSHTLAARPFHIALGMIHVSFVV